LIRWVEVRQRKREVNISEEIMNTIRNEYDQDLTIELFSSRLHFHPNYISRVFKKETGVTFTEYLSQYRVEIAKKWLRETDLKISDIADRLRYSTASNFNRNFRKLENVTPTEYRETYRSQADSRRQQND
jgi:two-component system response regulator YesN